VTIVLASLAPAAVWLGIAGRADREVVVQRLARQVAAGDLLEHAARGERARIARELHDVVAHHISMVAVQAETARLTTPGMPAAGAQRLAAIGDTARAALTEMRRLLGVLREDAQADVVVRRPQPGLQQLNELLDEARDASGAGTRLIIRGPLVALDPGVELAAYRIVQEALTNARRHAPGAAADVELHYTDEHLRVRIRDNGPGPAFVAPEGGHGLTGMRERAAAVGGRLRTGAAAGGGFVVEATLPATAEALG
jgi:signal transduction histidine kinase